MSEIIHTEADAKAALYAAMRRGTDPRWGAEPVAPIKSSRMSNITKTQLLIWAVVLIVLATMGVLS